MTPALETWLWRELGIDVTDGWRNLPPIERIEE